jgi:5-methylthioadenosine/S-adenosylhomocysteine deaminase
VAIGEVGSTSTGTGVADRVRADTILIGGDVVTMNERREVLIGGAIALGTNARGDGVIVDVGDPARLRSEHPRARIHDGGRCVITPGMVDAHQHLTGDPLLRSCIPDLLPAGESIFAWAVPSHAAHGPDDDEASALLTSLSLLLAGVTTVVEAGTVAHPDRVAGAMEQAGIRGTIGRWGWDEPGLPFAASPVESLALQRELLERHPGGGRVEGWVTLVGHGLVSDELFVGASELAREHGTGLTFHMSPTSSDPDLYASRHGRRPLRHLADLGVLGPHVLVAHGVWLDDEEVALVLEHDVAIAYCPWAYLRLGQGTTIAGRHAELVEAGGRVALGCDACNAADHHDILATAALAAGLARDMRILPTSFGAHQAFELATIAGARAVGMDARIGSIETGKAADLVVFDASGIEWNPRGDVGLQLVWGQVSGTVRDVFVDGRQVVAARRSTQIDHEELMAVLADRHESLLTRAGITVPHTWPYVVPT